MMMANMYKIKTNERGEKYVNLGRFYARSFKRQITQEFEEDLGFCIRIYKNSNPFVPTLLFFRKDDIGRTIKGFDALDLSRVVYINLFFKKSDWIMKIAPVKGGE